MRRKEHPSDTLAHALDHVLDEALKTMTPFLGKRIESVYLSRHEVATAVIRHMTTHLEVELDEIVTGRNDTGESIADLAERYSEDSCPANESGSTFDI